MSHSGPTPDARGHAWFEDVFTTHATSVRRYLVRRAPASEVDDLAAEVFATAWRRRDDIADDLVLPWLYRTAGYLLANFRRKGRPTPVEELPEESSWLDDPAVIVAADDAITTAIAALSPRDRHVLLLSVWEGLSGEELATALGISRGGAAAALSRARSRLAQEWSSDAT